jgi:hypothetical protein
MRWKPLAAVLFLASGLLAPALRTNAAGETRKECPLEPSEWCCPGIENAIHFKLYTLCRK